ncbi:uncharacterized protein LOC129590873 [Paramacrobiotus metropolitanus]|uniref:uncharacterized protein LOC129590873 n=1 Tax=Paramacrobiotus metropolitanus TaxID=2943436 RepID=UPI0024461729|nr:uncharacterized protein LOC129590873 [Paramacrobiotus metropolitanus]
MRLALWVDRCLIAGRCRRALWLAAGVIVLLLPWTDAASNQCTYYGLDRYSEPEPNLANCSWFAGNACCKRTEVTSVFADMFQLFGATQDCLNRISYLMCYFCSPDQYIWFRENKKASICRSFCESIYESCADASFTPEGETQTRLLKDLFVKNREKQSENTDDGGFCRDNFFDVVEGDKDCYRFDSTPFSHAPARLTTPATLLATAVGLLLLFRS